MDFLDWNFENVSKYYKVAGRKVDKELWEIAK